MNELEGKQKQPKHNQIPAPFIGRLIGSCKNFPKWDSQNQSPNPYKESKLAGTDQTSHWIGQLVHR